MTEGIVDSLGRLALKVVSTRTFHNVQKRFWDSDSTQPELPVIVKTDNTIPGPTGKGTKNVLEDDI